MPEASANSLCPECGCVLGPDAPRGLCAKCLIMAMLDGDLLPSGAMTLPREFGPYVLLEEVARGGMGIVYKARQPQLNRTVAVKVLAAGQFAAPDFVERFRIEAGAAASLDHPNIVPVYEAGECEGQPFFSMTLIEGRSLAERLAEGGSPVPEREAAEMAAKLAHAIHYAHQRGILHRDIKPGNVLLDSQGEPHLTDFGLAKLVEKDSALTRTMAMLGTPSYMSPEQARGEAKQLTTAVDIYGLGAIFHELLTGQPPFAGGTTMDTVRQVLEKEPRRPSSLRPGLDRDLETICLKCLEKDPARRYASAEALGEDLDRWRRHEPILARPASAMERLAKWIRRHQALSGALCVIAGVVIAGVSVSVSQAVRARTAEGLAYQRLGESRQNESRAEEARQENGRIAEERLRELVEMHVAAGNKLVDDGNALTGLLEFVEALRLDGGNPVRQVTHRARIAATLRSAPQLKQLWVRIRPGRLWSARFHPDGRRVLSSDEESRVRVFDAETGSPLNVPAERDVPAMYGWFTPDGRYLATVDEEGDVQHWDATTGVRTGQKIEAMVRTTAKRSYRAAMDYAPDGNLLIAEVKDGVRFFSVPSGEPAGPLLAASCKVTSVRFSPDGRTASICGESPSLQIVDVASGEVKWSPKDLTAPLSMSAFSRQGGKLVTMSEGLSTDCDVWDLERGERCMGTLREMPSAYDLQFSADGEKILFAGTWNAFAISMKTGRQTGEVMMHQSHITQFEQSSEGSRMATASYDRTARIWDPETGRQLTPLLPHSERVVEARFSPDGNRLLTLSADGPARLWELRANEGARLSLALPPAITCRVFPGPDGRQAGGFNAKGDVRIWDTRSGATLSYWEENQEVTAGGFDRSGTKFFTATADGVLHCRESATGNEIMPPRQSGRLNGMEISPDGLLLLTGGDDGKVRLWKTGDNSAPVAEMQHEGLVRHVSFGAGGRYIISGGDDQLVRVWSTESGQAEGPPLKLETPVLSAALNADGTRILTVRHHSVNERGVAIPGSMQLWDAKTRQQIGPDWRVLSGSGCRALFSSDGRRFLKLTGTDSVEISDAETGERIAPLLVHKFQPFDFAFSPDGRFLATGGGLDARVWDAISGEAVSPPLKHKALVYSMQWSTDGNELITWANEGKIQFWDMSPSELPLTELTRLSELLASRRLDPKAGAVSLSPAELLSRSKAMRSPPKGY